jgi:lysophospholipase L1-like esterase
MEFWTNFILTIDTGANAENVQITAYSGNTATVTRAFGGNNTSHAAGVAVTETDNVHLNAAGYQLVADAVAAYLTPDLASYANSAQKPSACALCSATH